MLVLSCLTFHGHRWESRPLKWTEEGESSRAGHGTEWRRRWCGRSGGLNQILKKGCFPPCDTGMRFLPIVDAVVSLFGSRNVLYDTDEECGPRVLFFLMEGT